MTRQETFDTVARHLLAQGCRSVNGEGNCQYRGTDGTKCAAGVLIPDEDYSPDMEGKLTCPHTLIGYFLAGLGYDLELVVALQRVHDYWPVEEWRDGLHAVAKKHGLSGEVLRPVAP